jgi:predicted metalloprotease
MDWRGQRESGNVEDDRGSGGIGAGHILGGGGILGLVIYLAFQFFGGGGNSSQLQMPPPQQSQQQQAGQDTLKAFVSVVLAETEDVWTKLRNDQGKDYPAPKLVLFTGSINSGCGGASAASGPFYCPTDRKVYIDLSFYQELRGRFGVSGDFAMAYVVAHEVGHHIQNLLGVSAKMEELRGRLSDKEYNRYSVKLELQADFYAGLWAHYARQMNKSINPEDIAEALKAANAIGDDRLQKQAQGYVVPDAFTHGTSAQRMYWFKRGYETGDMSKGDTFNDPSL